MHKRLFTAVLLISIAWSVDARHSAPVREMAVTFDDLPTVSAFPLSAAAGGQLTRDLIAAIRRHSVPAIGFVNEGKLYVDGRLDDERVTLLRMWIDGGLDLGNHTYSHMDRHTSTADEYQADVIRGETITRQLLASAGKQPRFFRHPFLHTGRSEGDRAAFEAFLRGRGYRVAPVTIDNYDYVFARAYDQFVHTGDAAQRQKLVAAYLDYMLTVVAYYEQQSAALLGREPRQVLLLHVNALNAATFDALAGRLEQRGYRFIALDRAIEDPAFSQQDTYARPGGISWIHRWAITQKKPGSFFAGEPEVPPWVTGAHAAREW